MLKRLRIRNFQTHRKRQIRFSPHVTTLTGKSDVGKSAIIRALQWVCLNRPVGDAFITHGEKQSQVELLLDNAKIRRTKGKENTYSIDGRVFKAFGREPPDDVQKTLRISELNFQQQHDAPFWLSLGAADVSRALNSIVDLSTVDTVMQSCGTKLRQANSERKAAEEEVDRCQQEVTQLKPIERFQKRVEQLQQREAEIASERERASLLRDLISRLSGVGRTLERSTAAKLGADNVLKAAANLRKAESEADSLRNLIDQIEAKEQATCQAKEHLEKVSQQQTRLMKSSCPLCKRPTKS